MLKGIDVSYSQGIIDWNKVKEQIDFAIVRCGYGDNYAGQDDSQWKRNADECTRLGIPFGAYIYSYATTDAQIRSEAEHILRCVKGYKLSLPIYLDLEEPGTESGAVGRAKIFADIIEKAGYWCGIYANLNWWNNYLTGLGNRYTKWIAQYNSTCDYKGGNLDIWQYSSSGKVNGISGSSDMNIMYRDLLGEISRKSGTSNTKPEQESKPEVKKVDWKAKVTELYITQLGREPDEKGLAFWEKILNEGTLSWDEVANGIIDSDEGRRRFIRELYVFLLGREPDEKGMNDWMDAIVKGMTRAEIYKAFVESAEYKNKK